MKSILVTIILTCVVLFACSPGNKAPEESPPVEQGGVVDTIPPGDPYFTKAIKYDNGERQQMKLFRQVSNFPLILDTAEFISQLREAYHLDVHESPEQKRTEQITFYKKVKLYGSEKDYIFIEYDWKVGSNAGYPWKHQILVDLNGEHIATFHAYRFDFIAIFHKKSPFLVIVNSTARGNGGHEFYKISADTVENVYEGYYDYAVPTYDAHQDLSVFQPNELKISVIDDNKDGYNDIVFTGEELMLGRYTKDSVWYDVEDGSPFSVSNPASRKPIRYVFLYDRISGHFKAKNKYAE